MEVHWSSGEYCGLISTAQMELKKLSIFFYVHVTVHLNNFFVIKPTRCTIFTNLFWHETLHVSESSCVHHQGFIYCTLTNGICYTAFEQDQDGTAVTSWSCSKDVWKPVWHIPLLSVQWINSLWWTEELSKTCTVSCQNKFVKLLHLVGFFYKETSICCFNIFNILALCEMMMCLNWNYCTPM